MSDFTADLLVKQLSIKYKIIEKQLFDNLNHST